MLRHPGLQAADGQDGDRDRLEGCEDLREK